MNNIPHSPENMELQYENDLRLGRELEKIEFVSKKMTEKYNEYEELKRFVEYLEGMEKLFMRAMVGNWADNKTKEELILSEIKFFSMDSGVDEDIFKTIRDDFGMVFSTVHQIYEVAEKLLKKYEACQECKDFIEYMKKISLLFFEAKKEHWNFNVIKESLCKFRMNTISADGNPEFEILDKIRLEFEEELLKK